MSKSDVPDLFSEYIPVIDKAEYHAKADNFPARAPYYQAYVHIGFFIGFLAEHHLLTEQLMSRKKVQRFLTRDIRAGELVKFLGGKIDLSDMTDEGKKFTYFYYAGDDKNGDVVGLSETV